MNSAKRDIARAVDCFGLRKNLICRFFASYFAVSALDLAIARFQGVSAIDKWQDFVMLFPLWQKVLLITFVMALLTVVYRLLTEKNRICDEIFLSVFSVTFSLLLVWRSGSFYLGLSASVVAVVFCVYAFGRVGGERLDSVSENVVAAIVFTSAALVTAFVAVTTVANHRNFGTSCYDMGIFVQMFHSLRENLTAGTTCERSVFLTHFQVHTSFIFYLFLPIFAIFPHPETLLIGQAVFAMAGVVPLYLIAKKRGFKGMTLVFVCLIYIFCGGLILPCYYCFHENAFLPTLLMWLLYAVDRKNIPLLYVMSVLTCTVKEDAPLYVICAGLFMLFDSDSKKRLHGIAISVLASAYFVLAMSYLNFYGDGRYMTSTRFGVLMSGSDGLGGIVRNVLIDPGYFFSMLIQDKTLLFVAETLLPLLLLPLLTKKLSRFILVVPYVIMNLVIGTGYGYAADIGFQYIFGPICFLIYLSVRNALEIREERRRLIIAACAVITVITTSAMASQKISALEYNWRNKEYFASAEGVIASVADDASVLANTFLLPHAAMRDEIYEFDADDFIFDDFGTPVGIKDLDRIDCCIFSLNDPNTELARPILESEGFKEIAVSEGDFVVIFERQ